MSLAPHPRALGLDAAGAAGWIGVVVDGAGFVGARSGPLAALVAWAEPVAAIAVDIPIGTVRGGREADRLARRDLGPRAASVFPGPPAEALAAAGYAELNARLAADGRPMLSRQAWGLVARMVEVAALVAVDDRIVEAHPEVCFAAMAGGPLLGSKKTWNGLLERRSLLRAEGIVLPDRMDDVVGGASDDVVDAAAAAWTGRRVALGLARSLPDPPEPGDDGSDVAIWCQPSGRPAGVRRR